MSEGILEEKRDSLVKVKVLEKGMRASVQVVSSLGEGIPPTVEMIFAALKKEKKSHSVSIPISSVQLLMICGLIEMWIVHLVHRPWMVKTEK